ncbi:MAG: hypothetical protein HOV80_05085 [Polyangiaceae bacterium]|nr:hypothetical protein [Polyangiaceae bacterium]
MTDAAVSFHDLEDAGGLLARVDEKTFDRRTVYAAAFTFIDRAWVRLDRKEPGRIDVVLREKSTGSLPAGARQELEDALYAARLQHASSASSGAWADSILLSALGSPEAEVQAPLPAKAAPSSALPAVDPEDLAAFDDPLGIAQSWEEKHRKPK